MASGFITLPNGKDWSARWTRYDYVLETIMNKLESDGDEGYLKKWLQFILPNEENGDVESGYCFYKKMGTNEDDFESIVRNINTNLMKETYFKIFWKTVAELNKELDSNDGGIGFLINQLNNCFIDSLTNVNNDDFTEEDNFDYDILNIGEFQIGK